MTNNTYDITVPLNIKYEIQITEKTSTEYTITQQISEWLHDNLADLVDDMDNQIFNKVNYGFNEDNLRNFGTKPVCDVYIDELEYDTAMVGNKPAKAHTIIIFYFKGANNNAYMELCKLHDYIMQEFCSNEDFQVLPGVVRDTYVENSRLMTQPIRKTWGVMGAFELNHILF